MQFLCFFFLAENQNQEWRWFLNYMKNSNIIPAKYPGNWGHEIMELNAKVKLENMNGLFDCTSILWKMLKIYCFHLCLTTNWNFLWKSIFILQLVLAWFFLFSFHWKTTSTSWFSVIKFIMYNNSTKFNSFQIINRVN